MRHAGSSRLFEPFKVRLRQAAGSDESALTAHAGADLSDRADQRFVNRIDLVELEDNPAGVMLSNHGPDRVGEISSLSRLGRP
jgi:hypothetical protein